MTYLETLLIIYPARRLLLDYLRPSDIMSLCVALGLYLTDNERRTLLTPLREIFESPLFTSDDRYNHHYAALVGVDVNKLSNSRFENIQVGLMINSVFNDSLTSSDEEVPTVRSSVLRGMMSGDKRAITNVRSNVSIVAFNVPEIDNTQKGKRITVYVSVTDNIGYFRASVNILLELVGMTDEVRNFKYVRRVKEVVIDVPYVLYWWTEEGGYLTQESTRRGVERLELTKTQVRTCRRCSAPIYTVVQPSECFWPRCSTIGTHIAVWLLCKVEPTCSEHSLVVDSIESNATLV